MMLQRTASACSRPQPHLRRRAGAARTAVAAAGDSDTSATGDVIVVTAVRERDSSLEIQDVHTASGWHSVGIGGRLARSFGDDGDVGVLTSDQGIQAVVFRGSDRAVIMVSRRHFGLKAAAMDSQAFSRVCDRIEAAQAATQHGEGRSLAAALSRGSHHAGRKMAVAAALEAGDISVGQVVEGCVESTVRYGAFVRLDCGLLGLLHISQITHTRISEKEIRALFKPGERIKALVVHVDVERGRWTLSTKMLERTPGDMLHDQQAVFDGAEVAAAAFRAGQGGTRS